MNASAQRTLLITLTGRDRPGGLLEPGASADLVVVPADRPEIGPGDLLHNLVYAASGSVVDTVVVDGDVVVRDGVVADEEESRARAYEDRR